MKSYITIFILSFFISCSSDSADSVSIPDPTPISKPVTPAPVVKYTLSVTAGEGGTVSTPGGTTNRKYQLLDLQLVEVFF